jgi:hypothetical protein
VTLLDEGGGAFLLSDSSIFIKIAPEDNPMGGLKRERGMRLEGGRTGFNPKPLARDMSGGKSRFVNMIRSSERV